MDDSPNNAEIVRQNFITILKAVKIEAPVIQMTKAAAPWMMQWYENNDIWLYDGSDGEHYACVGGQWFFLPTKRVPMTDINALLQAVSAHLLNEDLLSRNNTQEQEQIWATFQSMLLQTPIDQLSEKFRRARCVLEAMEGEQFVKEALVAVCDRHEEN